MRVFAAGLQSETNTFAPWPTGLKAYEETGIRRGAAVLQGSGPDHETAQLWARLCERDGHEFTPGLFAWAQPSGPTVQSVYEGFRDEILAPLRANGRFDVVLLFLHGAMVATACDDCQADLVRHVRARVGAGVPIGVELDPHCHLTMKRVSKADIIVLYKEFPHTDVVERAEDVLTLVLKTLRGQIKPVMSVYDCRQIQSYPTTLQPMRSLVDRLMAMEGKDGILSITIAHCFPYGDVAEIGTRVLVIADGDKKKADALATSLGEELVSLRGKTTPQYLDVKGGVGEGVAFNDLPVVIADPADNAGGGAPSDNTDILKQLIEARVENACIGPIWDPIAVRICFDAGLGAKINLRFGGKIAVTSGQPVDAEVEVIGLKRDAWQRFGPTQVPVGDCAAVRVGGVDVVLIANRTQATGLELFRNVGIEPTEKKIVVVKSTNHFMAAYGPIAKKVIYIDSNGPLKRDPSKIAYTKVERPIWPIDADAKPRGLIF